MEVAPALPCLPYIGNHCIRGTAAFCLAGSLLLLLLLLLLLWLLPLLLLWLLLLLLLWVKNRPFPTLQKQSFRIKKTFCTRFFP